MYHLLLVVCININDWSGTVSEIIPHLQYVTGCDLENFFVSMKVVENTSQARLFLVFSLFFVSVPCAKFRRQAWAKLPKISLTPPPRGTKEEIVYESRVIDLYPLLTCLHFIKSGDCCHWCLNVWKLNFHYSTVTRSIFSPRTIFDILFNYA